MKTDNKFIINTFDKESYAKISADLPENQLHIIDDNDIYRTVIPSYGLVSEIINDLSSKYVFIADLRNALSAISSDMDNTRVEEMAFALFNIKSIINKI